MVDREYLDDPDKLYALLAEIKTSIMDWANTPIASNIDLQITQFSDSIVFSFIPTRHYFMTFHFFKELSIKMIMKHKVIFRGGITFGKIFHDAELLFGPAMNCAYRLESVEAKFPRIVIDERALQLKNDDGKTISDYPGQFIFQLNNSDYSYVDYIVDVNGYVNQSQYYDILRGLISNGLESENTSIKTKYEWMKQEYNRAKTKYSGLVSL